MASVFFRASPERRANRIVLSNYNTGKCRERTMGTACPVGATKVKRDSRKLKEHALLGSFRPEHTGRIMQALALLCASFFQDRT